MKRNELTKILKSEIRDIKNFPKKGIVFKDLTTVFKSDTLFSTCIDSITDYYKNKGISKVLGIESRGFIMAGAIANKLNIGFVPIRKPGKLPYDTYSQKYSLEYGYDEIEIHIDALCKDDIVLLHDDLLATGGTMSAAINLVKKFQVKKIYVNFLCELEFLKGRQNISEGINVYSLVSFS